MPCPWPKYSFWFQLCIWVGRKKKVKNIQILNPFKLEMLLTSPGSSIWIPFKHVASSSTAPSQPSYHWFCCSLYFRPQLSKNLGFNLTSRWWNPCLCLLRLFWALFSFHGLYCVGVIEAKQKVWFTSRGQKFCLEAEQKTEEESRKQRTLFLAKDFMRKVNRRDHIFIHLWFVLGIIGWVAKVRRVHIVWTGISNAIKDWKKL